MKSRPAIPEIKALTDVLNFGKYKGQQVQDIIKTDPSYILYLSDEKIAKFSDKILQSAEDSELEMDGELKGMMFWDFINDD